LTGLAASRSFVRSTRGRADATVAQPFDSMSGRDESARWRLDPARHQHAPVDADIIAANGKLALTETPPVGFCSTVVVCNIMAEKEVKLEVRK
jgi:hypothetical protein